MMKPDILIVDDEADIRELLADTLKDEGYTTRAAKNSFEALAAFAERVPSAVILDIWLKESELDGLGILETIKKKYEYVPVLMISGHGNIETAISAIRMGAYDYIEKPFKEDRLLLMVQRAIETARLKQENNELKVKAAPSKLIGESQYITGLRASIDKVAPTNSRVFITGPAGSGKEVVARLIHEKSQRKSHPFVVLNAASISEARADYELFGTEDSSDVNSSPRKIGLFERANGGTLFIDEITDMPLSTQGKLLRFLQDQSFERIGAARMIKADVRVIAASIREVQNEIRMGRMREDLFYRLNVVPLKVPYLYERREDIPLIAKYFLKIFAKNNGLPERTLSEEAIAVLQSYEWPGNIRQLRNMIEWLLIMAPGNSDVPISPSALPREMFNETDAVVNPEVNLNIMSMPLREARECFEKKYLSAQVGRFGGNISKTSHFIGMERSALHRKLKSLNIGADEKEDAHSAVGP